MVGGRGMSMAWWVVKIIDLRSMSLTWGSNHSCQMTYSVRVGV